MKRLQVISVVALATVGAYAAFQVSSAQDTTRKNLKAVATATLMYSSDFDDVLPRPLETKSWFAAILPYCRSAKLFFSGNPNSHLIPNLSVGGMVISKIKNPAKTVLLYDEKPWKDGSYLVAFCDGHVALVSARDWKILSKTLHFRGKPSAKALPKDYWKSFPWKDLPGQAPRP